MGIDHIAIAERGGRTDCQSVRSTRIEGVATASGRPLQRVWGDWAVGHRGGAGTQQRRCRSTQICVDVRERTLSLVPIASARGTTLSRATKSFKWPVLATCRTALLGRPGCQTPADNQNAPAAVPPTSAVTRTRAPRRPQLLVYKMFGPEHRPDGTVT